MLTLFDRVDEGGRRKGRKNLRRNTFDKNRIFACGHCVNFYG